MQKLVQGLHKFQTEIFSSQEKLFRCLEKGQNPQVLFITCSDSRIDPSLITQTDPGDLFIIRNAGNIVPSFDQGSTGEMASIEFAIVGLGIKDIIICGHSHCGAMQGLLTPQKLDNLPTVKAWLKNAQTTQDVVFKHYKHLSGDALLMATIEENVLMQIENLKTHPVILRKIESGEVKLHGWVYKFETGVVNQFNPETEQFEPIMKPIIPGITDMTITSGI